jgi:hypothetical protein
MNSKERFYINNPQTRKHILKFFTPKSGVRCRVKHPHGEVHPVYRNNATSAAYGGKYGYPLTDINRENINYELKTAATQHFLYYIFDEGIRQCNSKSEIADHIIGITCTMDVDSPYINTVSKKKTRFDSLGAKGKRVRVMFDILKNVAKNELTDVGYWKKTRVMWSGNGFYIILPDFYGSPSEIAEHMHGFVGMEKHINAICRTSHNFTQPLCDERTIPWNRYAKSPFTFHAKYARVSVPLNREASFVDGVKCNMIDW